METKKVDKKKYKWVNDPTPAKRRTTGLGVKFSGHYERVKKNE